MAVRFGVITSAALGAAAWLSGGAGGFGFSMFGSEMGGMNAELSGGFPRTLISGLLAGALTGFAGSFLCGLRRAAVKRGSEVVADDG